MHELSQFWEMPLLVGGAATSTIGSGSPSASSLFPVYRTVRLSPSIVLPLMWLGLAMSLFAPMAGAETLFIAPKDAIVGAMAGYLSLWSVYQLFKLVTGKEGMGYGDFKLLAALGAWLGWQSLPLIILMSAVVGAVVGIGIMVIRKHERGVPIPFGPYLAAAGWITMLWGDTIQHAYLDMLL